MLGDEILRGKFLSESGLVVGSHIMVLASSQMATCNSPPRSRLLSALKVIHPDLDEPLGIDCRQELEIPKALMMACLAALW